MTPTVLHALKGQRNVEELLRAIPNALRPLLAFDRVSLALDRSVTSTASWQGLDGECGTGGSSGSRGPGPQISS